MDLYNQNDLIWQLKEEIKDLKIKVEQLQAQIDALKGAA